MRKTPFTFCVVRYVHDVGANECLNVGVVLYSPSEAFLDALVDHRFERLSTTFHGFSGDHYRSVRSGLLSAVHALGRDVASKTLLRPSGWNVSDAIQSVWPDRDLSFSIGPSMGGITSDPATELKRLFERMVVSQGPVKPTYDHRSDDDVWSGFQSHLSPVVRQAFTPKTFETPAVTVEFDRAFKNGRWHAVQPVSLDYKQADTIQKHATHWVGVATGLGSAVELEKIYFLIGAPRNQKHAEAYEKALNLLHRAPVKHEIIREDDAPGFAKRLEGYMREHGVFEKL